jgi:hypothetical protein
MVGLYRQERCDYPGACGANPVDGALMTDTQMMINQATSHRTIGSAVSVITNKRYLNKPTTRFAQSNEQRKC